PVRRKEIKKPSGGTRMLGIPTVLGRFIQQLLLQAMTPIWEPLCSQHSYGFRPGRSAHDAVRAAQRYTWEAKDWVADLATIHTRLVGVLPTGRESTPDFPPGGMDT